MECIISRGEGLEKDSNFEYYAPEDKTLYAVFAAANPKAPGAVHHNAIKSAPGNTYTLIFSNPPRFTFLPLFLPSLIRGSGVHTNSEASPSIGTQHHIKKAGKFSSPLAHDHVYIARR